jgi:tRNA (guanine37-N1)-methyltransferase
MLKQALGGVLSESEISLLTSSFDVIGDIAILKIPPELSGRDGVIGDEILRRLKNVKTVLKQVSDVEGEFRIRQLSFVAGEEKYCTTYRESGVLMKVDVRSVYFSPRLSTERLRIKSLVKEGEHIFNMFAGIGTFSLIIAKYATCEIESVDKNPEAIRLAKESLKLNKKLKGRVNPILDDAKSFAEKHSGEFDRILMPLPERSSEFLDTAVASARLTPGGVIHYYVHVPENEFRDPNWIDEYLEQKNLARKYRLKNWKRVREVGPRFVQAVADIELL